MKVSDIAQQQDFVFAVCKFLDEFKRSNDQYEMICDEPTGVIEPQKRCILAAISHKLANDIGISIPTWVSKPDYFLSVPIYSFDTQNKEYQSYLMQNTPHEFAIRNIFYGANAIERV